MPTEQEARETIDRLLAAAGWHVTDPAQANIHAGRGVAIREFELQGGHGTDIKPVEIVVFMRSVKSRSFFEQMKGRGVRGIMDDDLNWCRGTTCGRPERIAVSEQVRAVRLRWHMHRQTIGAHGFNGEVPIPCS